MLCMFIKRYFMNYLMNYSVEHSIQHYPLYPPIEYHSLEGGSTLPKTKSLFFGVVPCKEIYKDASWFVYEKGDYDAYNKIHNKYGIRETNTYDYGSVFKFIEHYVKKLNVKTDYHIVLQKGFVPEVEIDKSYKNKIVYLDMKKYGENLTSDDFKKYGDCDFIYLAPRFIETILDEKPSVKDKVMKENVYKKSMELPIIKFFVRFLRDKGYMLIDDCSGAIPFRKLGEKDPNPYKYDLDDKDLHAMNKIPEEPVMLDLKKGIPKRDYRYDKYFNDFLLVSRLCYPTVWRKFIHQKMVIPEDMQMQCTIV